MSELISIIVPVYKTEKYLPECIESIINQTYKNLEIILVNDGSPDKCGEICDMYAKKDNRIIVIHQENKGLVEARKTGIIASNGNLIGFVDSDDFIEPDMYEHMYDMMTTYDVELVQIEVVLEYDKYSRIAPSGIKGKYTNNNKDVNCSYKNMYAQFSDSKQKINGSLCRKLFKKSTLEEFQLHLPSDIILGEDAAVSYSCIPFLKSIYISDKVCYHYRQHISPTKANRDISQFKGVDMFYKYVTENFKKHHDKDLLLKEFDDIYIQIVADLNERLFLPESLNARLIKYNFNTKHLKNAQNILIYGVGKVGKSYIGQFHNFKEINIAGIIDKHEYGTSMGPYEVIPPEEIKNIDYDLLIIAVKGKGFSESIKEELLSIYDIDEDKIIWHEPERVNGLLFSKTSF